MGERSAPLPFRDDEGRVVDLDTAQLMGAVEDVYREKRLGGLLRPSKRSVEEGKQLAEKVGRDYHIKKIGSTQHEQFEKEQRKRREETDEREYLGTEHGQLKHWRSVLIENLKMNPVLQNKLQSTKQKLEDLVAAGMYGVFVSPLYQSKDVPRFVLHIDNQDRKFKGQTIVHFSKPDGTIGVKKYAKHTPQGKLELEEDLVDWAQSFAGWGEREGLK